MVIKISIRELKIKIYHFDEYVVFNFLYKRRVFVQIIRKIHIVNDFKIDMFIKINIFISKKMIIDFVI